jgi:outer membrane lipoprotein-sorting protein
MKSIFALVTFCALLAAPVAAQTPTVDELLAKNMQARGGQKLKNINTRKVTGHVSTQGVDMQMTVLAKRPSMMLQEMKMGDRRLVTAYDGSQAWGLNPMIGDTPQVLQGIQASLLKDQAYFDGPLALAKSRNDTIEVAGKEDIEGAPAWKLSITHEGRVTSIYLDAQTGLERKVSTTVTEGGQNLLIESVISDFQPTDGIMVPRKVNTVVGGQQQATVTIDSVEFDVPVDDAQFRMPAK